MSSGNKMALWPVFIAAGVMLSTLGSVHGSILTGGGPSTPWQETAKPPLPRPPEPYRLSLWCSYRSRHLGIGFTANAW